MDNIISEIFEKYQVRKIKKQKDAFIEYTKKMAEENGWDVNVEKGALGVRNIVLGKPEDAKVIYTAHYDTCAVLPFPNFLTPKSIFIYILYNIAVVLGFFAAAALIGGAVGFICGIFKLGIDIAKIAAEVVYFGLLILVFAGSANKHTANDNTSGVTVLFGIMKNLPAECRSKVAIVFFDHEESGLIGSGAFAKNHKRVKNETLLINFDCVSDGEDMLIVAKKDAWQYRELLAGAFLSDENVNVTITDNAFYPSDQAKFKKGVGVAAFKKTRRGLLYMNRIHTPKDTVYRRENVDFLIDGALKLADVV